MGTDPVPSRAGARTRLAWVVAAGLAASAAAAVDLGMSGAYKTRGKDLTAKVLAAEVVSVSGRPAGQPTSVTGKDISYTVPTATSNLGHLLEYRFAWGDGTYSAWSDAITVAKRWTAAGTFAVKTEARCKFHPAVTALSEGLSMAVTAAKPATLEASL